jgi:hypothetical protein
MMQESITLHVFFTNLGLKMPGLSTLTGSPASRPSRSPPSWRQLCPRWQRMIAGHLAVIQAPGGLAAVPV